MCKEAYNFFTPCNIGLLFSVINRDRLEKILSVPNPVCSLPKYFELSRKIPFTEKNRLSTKPTKMVL